MRAPLWLVFLALACGTPTPSGTGGGGGFLNTGGGSASGGGSGGGTGGATCTTSSDCSYWYCQCVSTTTPVNSRTCLNRQCASVSTACNDGCSSFGGWTGQTYSATGGGSGSGGGGGGSSSSGQPGSACATRFDCLAQTCGCTDGAVLTVRDCLNSFCNSHGSTCESACVDSGHGHWDGF